MRIAVIAVAMAIAALVGASAAWAHASLVSSEPADQAVVASPPSELLLRFNETVSPIVLRLVHPSGDVVELPSRTQGDGATIAVALPPGLTQGTHLLSWRVISADSHPVGGSLTFSIGHPTTSPAATQAIGNTRTLAATWFVRLVLYVGLFLGVGGAFFSTWFGEVPRSDNISRVIAGALISGLIATVLSVGLQGVDVLGLAVSSLREPHVWASGLATAYGFTLCLAAAALASGLAAIKTPLQRASRWYSAIALLLVGVALAASGHASTAGPELLTRPAVFLHCISVAFWVGSLPVLLPALRANSSLHSLAAFSKVIPWPLLTLVVSGMVLAIVQVQRVDALWLTAYGNVLLCKLVAVGALLILAACNRWATPRVLKGNEQATRRLRHSIVAELAIVAAILGMVALWRFTPPPRSLLLAAAQPVQLHVHDEKAMAELRIETSPGTRGRTFSIGLLDGQFQPLKAKEVELVLSKPDIGVEPLRRPATQIGDVDWKVDDVRLPSPGRWHVQLQILISDFEKVSLQGEVDLPR